MKVIKQTILDKIDDAINYDSDNKIIRIELTCKEFEEAVNLVGSWIKWRGWEVKKEFKGKCNLDKLPPYGQAWSESHFIYRGICIQTHYSYE